MMWGWFDPYYLLFLAPAMLLAVWAQIKVQSAYREASQIPARSRLSGAQAADAVLRQAGVRGVQIEPTEGFLSDHYVPGERVLDAAALTYVAATLTSVMTLLYFLFRSGLLGQRSND